MYTAPCTDTEQVDAENPDHELIWNIHLLSQVLYNFRIGQYISDTMIM